MKKLLQRFETSMMAVAFAEAGEFDAALQMAHEDEKATPPSLDARIRGAKRTTQRKLGKMTERIS